MKKSLILLFALLISISNASADKLIVKDFKIPQGGQAYLTINYQFDEANLYSGFQFSLTLPEGLSTVKNETGKENFELISLPFELDLASLDVKEVKLIKANVFVVEGNGINIEYELEIEYEFLEDKKEIEVEMIDDTRPKETLIDEEISNDFSPVDIITDVEFSDLEEDLEEVKEDTKEYYEEMLEKKLRDNVEVVTTKSNMDTESFLAFFDNNITYYRLKCIHIENEKELEEISKKYNVKIEELLNGYDKDTKKVIFKIE